ncbi:RNA polymerase sigma-70 factor [Pedobacter sp. MC2016-14]|uniref:RNA polymerase sigma-70 factor n=1 Tax=Pedobacter sp. MC2016-14 TaxID=2897327 RepID=UPI001E5F253E|nr:RNA polymerase sigma-70 factor [Pedobacter sp. MC2016-14]MCD0489803.1 RNA polymerase sigma-70 factor [Pedobacter sp. MC2016-14]
MEPGIKKDEFYWLELFKRREENALAYFFDLHYKSLCYFSNRLILDEAEAEDIVADSFIRLWKGDQDNYTAQSIKAFLYISCRNACFNYLKRIKVKTVAQEIYHNQLEMEDRTILNKIIKAEVLEMLVQEIELLPEKCREVFKLLYFEDKKTDEIALQLGISAKTVRNHKAKAIALIKVSILKKGITDAFYLACLIILKKY